MGFTDRFRRVGDVKFSVVIAVYNTGAYIEPCLDSLLAQTMAADEFEVILVDDGSDDKVTAKRIDRFAKDHRNAQAIHIPNSGWPGRPRNVGVDVARGEYVYFLDHDDSLGPEALERMYAMASRNHADVIIGKIAGHGRRVPTTLFRRDYESCSIETAPLLESMTPHKGFRRAFLLEHGIRFPEGRRRLEDHVYVIEAYLLAEVVSVLSDYTCYHHIARDDAGNAGFQRLEPVGYYGNLREAIDVAERLTEPGPRRDLVLRRWYSIEMLRRVTGKVFAGMAEKQRRVMYAEVRRLALERFTSEEIWSPLPAAVRVVSELLRADRYAELVELAGFEASLSMAHEVRRWEWEDGCLRLEAVIGSRSPDGVPALTVVDGTTVYAAHLTSASTQARTATTPATASLELRLRKGTTRRRIPLDVEPVVDEGVVHYRVTGAVDPRAVAGAPLAPGVWDLFLRLRDLDAGPELVRRMGAEHGTVSAPPPPPAVVGDDALVVIPYVTVLGNLTLDVGERTKQLAAVVGEAGAVSDGSDAHALRVELPLHVDRPLPQGLWTVVTALDGQAEGTEPATARPGELPGRSVVEATLPPGASATALAWARGKEPARVPLTGPAIMITKSQPVQGDS